MEKADYNTALAAVRRGDSTAKTRLAYLLITGLGGATVNPKDAVTLLEERVKENDAEAMWMLGLCKEYGTGTSLDTDGAMALYTTSSGLGNEMGALLEDNDGDDKRGCGLLSVARLWFFLLHINVCFCCCMHYDDIETTASTPSETELFKKLFPLAPWTTLDFSGMDLMK